MLNTPNSKKLAFPISVMAKPRGPLCNVGCDYCFYLRKKGLFDDGSSFRMSHEVLEAYTKQYIECMSDRGTVNFLWQGGEPTLMGLDFFKEAVALQKAYKPEGCEVVNGLQTNGMLIDDEWCRFFAENEFLIGLSMDGPAELHDVHRRTLKGDGTHARVVETLRRLKEHGVDTNILCLVNSDNAKHPREVYRYLRQEGITWMQFIPGVEQNPDGSLTEWSVSPSDWGDFLCGLFDEWHKQDIGVVHVQIFNNAIEAAAGQNPSLCVHSQYCGNNVVIEHNGDVYSCDHFVSPEHRLGNIIESNLADIVQTPSQVQWGMSKHDKLSRECRECEFLKFCNGGCLKDRHGFSKYGEPDHNMLCGGYLKFYTHTGTNWNMMAMWIMSGHSILDYKPAGMVEQIESEAKSIRRNDPCPCGSGKKYKRCCGR